MSDGSRQWYSLALPLGTHGKAVLGYRGKACLFGHAGLRAGFTIIAGNPGLGKSQVTISIAAVVTTGGDGRWSTTNANAATSFSSVPRTSRRTRGGHGRKWLVPICNFTS